MRKGMFSNLGTSLVYVLVGSCGGGAAGRRQLSVER